MRRSHSSESELQKAKSDLEQALKKSHLLEKLNADLESSLLERNYRLSEVFESVPGEVLWLSPDLHYVKVNSQTALAEKRYPVEYEGKPLGFSGRPLHLLLKEEIGRNPTGFSGLAPFDLSEGPRRWRVALSKYKNGQDTLAVLIPCPSTGDSTQGDRLSDQPEQLSSARLATLGEMVAGIAHELNNPLAVLSGRIQVLRNRMVSGLLSNEELLVELDKQAQSVFRVSKIIKGLRSFAKPGMEREVPEDIEPSRGIDDALDFCRGRYHKRNIEVRLLLNCADLVRCVPVQLTQILLNLLNNSLHAVEDRDERWVEIRTESSGRFVDFFVMDSGAGVPAEIAGRIFEPFFSTRPQQAGTGLGLSISRGLAESNGGQLRLLQGTKHTSFVLSMPRAASTSEN